MNDTDLDLNEPYKYCFLLNIEIIKKEIENYLKGYILYKIEKRNDEFICIFCDDKNNKIDLILKMTSIRLLKYTENVLERIFINKYSLYEQQILEKRPNGIIYTSIQKDFTPSKRFKNRYILMDLFENRYILTANNINEIAKKMNIDNGITMQFLLKLMHLEHENELKNYSDLITIFSTYLNYHLLIDTKQEDLYSAKTSLNGEDITNLYDFIEGEDKLYRIYDLYRGIINPRNEYDIHSIHLGNIKQDAFDLKSLKGITQMEDNLVGTFGIASNEYIKYLKQLLSERYGYTTNFQLDRELILKGITYQTHDLDSKKVMDENLYADGTRVFENSARKELRKILSHFIKK